MNNNYSEEYPAIAQKGLQFYVDNMTRRYELLDRVIQAVSDGNEYQAIQALRARNDIKIPGRLESELAEWKYDLIQIKTLLIYVLRRIGVSEMRLDGIHTEYTRKIDNTENIEECRKLSEEMVLRFCSIHQSRSLQTYSPLIQKILLAVDMDLSQNLTLQFFSGNLNVNASYLSNLFRREVGMTLTEYVTERRIRQAQDLLLTTQNPIKMIAKQVGINDVHYFSRLFRKKTGKTPSDFRLDRG